MQKLAPLVLLLLVAGCGRAVNYATTAAMSRPAVRAEAPTLRKDVTPVLVGRCTRCHGSWVKDGEPQYALIKRNIDQAILRIQHRNMPKDAPGSVTDDELAALKGWRDAGALDN